MNAFNEHRLHVYSLSHVCHYQTGKIITATVSGAGQKNIKPIWLLPCWSTPLVTSITTAPYCCTTPYLNHAPEFVSVINAFDWRISYCIVHVLR